MRIHYIQNATYIHLIHDGSVIYLYKRFNIFHRENRPYENIEDGHQRLVDTSIKLQKKYSVLRGVLYEMLRDTLNHIEFAASDSGVNQLYSEWLGNRIAENRSKYKQLQRQVRRVVEKEKNESVLK